MRTRLDRRSLLDAIREQHGREPFSGVIDVRERGDVVVAEAFGMAQRAEGSSRSRPGSWTASMRPCLTSIPT